MIGIMRLFPPWMTQKPFRRHHYAFITYKRGSIEKQRLCVQIGVVALVTAGLVVSLKGMKAKDVNNGV